MTNEDIFKRISDQFSSYIIASDETFGILNIEINPNNNTEIVQWLKEDSILQFSFLTNIAGIHYPDSTGREIAVVYQLHSWRNNSRLRLKAYLSIDNPTIDSIVHLYNGANWMERETFDFFGVNFKNHPDLRRILNEDSMDYFPMRKEHPLEDATRQDKDDRFFGRF
ncbi:MAG: NADH-quinone oxidoreductase subunit C [Bacteroidota bacterium]